MGKVETHGKLEWSCPFSFASDELECQWPAENNSGTPDAIFLHIITGREMTFIGISTMRIMGN